MAKNRTVWAVIGSLLVIIGGLWFIPLALNRFILGLLPVSLMVIIGVILIAWAISD